MTPLATLYNFPRTLAVSDEKLNFIAKNREGGLLSSLHIAASKQSSSPFHESTHLVTLEILLQHSFSRLLV